MKKINIDTIKNIIKGIFVFIFDTIVIIMKIIDTLVRRTTTCIIDICDEVQCLLFDYID